MDSFQITRVSGKRVDIVTWLNGMKMSRISKNLAIDKNNIIIKFGSKPVKIGTVDK